MEDWIDSREGDDYQSLYVRVSGAEILKSCIPERVNHKSILVEGSGIR